MIPRRTFLLAAAAFLGAALAALPATRPATAQDRERGGDRKRGHDGKDDGKDDEKGKSKDEDDKGSKDGKDGEKEQTPEEKELRALGGEFARKDVAALIRRVPADVGDGKEGKVRLRLGDEDGTFGRTQAREILEKWLEARTITRVRLKSTKDLVGTFTLKFRVRGKEKEFERTLVARIARAEGDAFVLKELEVQRQ